MIKNIRKVAVVTGANKGIGFDIVRALCKQFDGDVYLTARNEVRGRKAVKELENEGLSPKCHLLDIKDMESIVAMRKFIEHMHGGFDILVNNAEVAILNHSMEEGIKIIETNYTSIIRISKVLFPLLRANARVVNVSSRHGIFVVKKMDEEFKAKFSCPKVTIEGLTELIWEYYSHIYKHPEFSNKVYFDVFAYGLSKLGVTRLTTFQQRQLSSDSRNILVNATCPGYVDTDMTKICSLILQNLLPDKVLIH